VATYKLVVLPGDGVGPEVVSAGLEALKAVERRFALRFELTEDVVGGACIDRFGVAIRPETLERCRRAHAVLLGAVGGPKWDDPTAPVRPEQGLLALRKGLGLFANLRPVKVYPYLAQASTLRPEVLEGVDMVVVRELTGVDFTVFCVVLIAAHLGLLVWELRSVSLSLAAPGLRGKEI
jgi:3-isopropylmalate dehydrogenase